MFDAVFLSFMLELFEGAIPEVLVEVRRVLRVGGRVGIVAMSNTGETNAMTDLYEWLHRRWPQFIDCKPINLFRALQAALAFSARNVPANRRTSKFPVRARRDARAKRR
jgi:demethylmenaquinone methyltransferase/2-methoxy-6-polyprenyl-1,4-benzoquinol methylase